MSLTVDRVPVAELRQFPGNPRRGDVDAIAASLQRLGQYRPIVVRRATNEVLAGNHTLQAAVRLGWAEIDVTYVDADEQQARAIVAADNRLADLGTYDDEDLASLLQAIDDRDLRTAAGYDEEDLASLLASLEPPFVPQADPDDVPEPLAEPVTQHGDLWTLGDHRLLCGDSTSAEDVDRLLAGDAPALVFTSPPYSDVRTYEGGGDLSPAHLAEFIGTWSSARLLAVNLGLIRRDNEIQPYWQAYLDAATAHGLKLLAWNVWDRQLPQSIAQHTAMFPLEHEWVFVFGEKRTTLNRTVANKMAGTMRTGRTNRQADGTLQPGRQSVVHERRPLGSIFRSPPHIGADSGHPAMFPVVFPTAYIEACTDPGDLVADPFGGAGTTLIAAQDTGRRAVVMELAPRYCDLIVARWEAFTGQKAERTVGTAAA